MTNSLTYGKFLIAIMMGGCSFTAMAVGDGTITFSGSIKDATCEISGGDETLPDQGADFTVTLPTVNVTALAKSGDTAGDTPFYINLSGSNCPNGKIADVIFDNASSMNIDTTTGNLKNTTATTAGGADNVQIRILNNNRTALNLTQSNSAHQSKSITANKATFTYYGQYVAVNGASSAGEVKTDVVYSIKYQ